MARLGVQPGMSIDPTLFRTTLGRFASGITVITVVDAGGRDHGMTVSAFSSVSLEPPLVLVCIDNDATMAPVMAEASSFAVNILRDDQQALSQRFSSRVDDRFAGIPRSHGPLGNALLDGALAALECRIVQRIPAGDHVIVLGAVEHAAVHEGEPLLYFRSGYARLTRG